MLFSYCYYPSVVLHFSLHFFSFYFCHLSSVILFPSSSFCPQSFVFPFLFFFFPPFPSVLFPLSSFFFYLSSIFLLFSSIFFLLFSVLFLLPLSLCPLPSVISLLSFFFCPPSFVLHLLPSLFCPFCSIAFPQLSFVLLRVLHSCDIIKILGETIHCALDIVALWKKWKPLSSCYNPAILHPTKLASIHNFIFTSANNLSLFSQDDIVCIPLKLSKSLGNIG